MSLAKPPSDCFWESLPLRRDRVPNELNDVAQLWQTVSNPHHPMNQSTPTFFKTEFGNINGNGVPTSFSSPILGMRNTLLASSLEPRIAPLVMLIKELGLITYSSCEGHLIEGDFYEAYAGLLYDETQQAATKDFLCLARTSGFVPFRTWLVDSLDGTRSKTVEIYFPRDTSMSLAKYHRALSQATSTLAASLQS